MFALSAVLAAVLTPSAPVPAAPPTDTKTELARWQGTWEVELQISDGAEKPEKERNIAKVVIQDDVWEVYFKDAGDPVKGKMKLVLDGKVKGMDVVVGDAVFRSIYL